MSLLDFDTCRCAGIGCKIRETCLRYLDMPPPKAGSEHSKSEHCYLTCSSSLHDVEYEPTCSFLIKATKKTDRQ